MMEVLMSMLLLRGMPVLLPSRRRDPCLDPFLVAEALMPIIPLLIMKKCFLLDVAALASYELAREELLLMLFLVSTG